MHPHRKAAAVIGALALGTTLVALTGPAQAATPSATPVASRTPKVLPTPEGDGAKGICKRLPKADQRIKNALDRLNGPVTEAGSIARLQQRVNNAKAAGHTAIYNDLNDRLTYRKSLVPTLTQRQSDLNAVATWCSSQGLGTPTAQ
ncbi:hypothetical protein ACFXPX_30090 [Kitasatospora sp. NPDC059146]|uniref:hypothetical protein n=1 Tax=unclassified Kitasatospora TaxID=2633591 RepID=UPI0036CD082F